MSLTRFARGASLAGFLAASLAALPSLDWCPLAAWEAQLCGSPASGGPAFAGEPDASDGVNHCASTPACAAASAGCDASVPWPCDREPDPVPFGDAVWCIRPPVIAIAERTEELPAPSPSAQSALIAQVVEVAPPAPPARARFGPMPGPPALRAPHAPSRPRAPPIG